MFQQRRAVPTLNIQLGKTRKKRKQGFRLGGPALAHEEGLETILERMEMRHIIAGVALLLGSERCGSPIGALGLFLDLHVQKLPTQIA